MSSKLVSSIALTACLLASGAAFADVLYEQAPTGDATGLSANLSGDPLSTQTIPSLGSVTLDKIKAQLAIESSKHDLQRELAAMPTPDEVAATVRGENIASNPRTAPQVATPAVEPPGRAPDGQAFAR